MVRPLPGAAAGEIPGMPGAPAPPFVPRESRMVAFLSVLPAFIVPDPDSTTRRDKAQTRAAVAKLSYHWTVTERTDRPAAKGMARRHLVVEMHGAVAMPVFRLDRHGATIVLSEHDDTGAWMLGRFDGMDAALAALRRAAMARFAGAVGAPMVVPGHAATV